MLRVPQSLFKPFWKNDVIPMICNQDDYTSFKIILEDWYKSQTVLPFDISYTRLHEDSNTSKLELASLELLYLLRTQPVGIWKVLFKRVPSVIKAPQHGCPTLKLMIRMPALFKLKLMTEIPQKSLSIHVNTSDAMCLYYFISITKEAETLLLYLHRGNMPPMDHN